MNLYKLIGKRLSDEAGRSNIHPEAIAADIGEDVSRILSLFAGKPGFDIDLVEKVCSRLGINPFWVLSKEYSPSKVHFRNLNSAGRSSARKVEQAFYLVAEYLPTPEVLDIAPPDRSLKEQGVMSGQISNISESIKEIGYTPESIFRRINLPIIPVKADDFDAFLLCTENKYAVCVNSETAPVRIIFSLLHELAHFLFHRDTEVSPLKGYRRFNQYLTEDEMVEFESDKFAQHFLVPFKQAEKWAVQYPNVDPDDIQPVVDQSRTSRDVLAYAIHDQLMFRNKDVTPTEVKGHLEQIGIKHGPAGSIHLFLNEQKELIRNILHIYTNDFSENVLKNTLLSLDLENG
ncbi:ImmA/IrrE family metallo-endopeptidase [Desulfonatronovibrio hydrogenovorans]|uniref:ImmA/IrrE family metallo-endopeptidase n=1 Tax=Desulfonatronovibrio hydrogenovorans TaxID=53245 RepID=UPI00048D65CB|nr:ImmA/IrrE family metallo-endopeptidase [Desulfonatronovibrio hydrogenovorans]